MDSNYPLKKHNLKNSDLRPKSENQESVRVPEDRRHSDEVPYTFNQLQSKAFEFGLNRGFSQNPSTVQSYESLNSENSDFEFSEVTGHEKSPSWPVTVHSKIPCEPYTIAVSKQSQTWSSSTPMLAEHKSLSSTKQGNTLLFQKRDTENPPDDSYAGSKHYHKPKSSMRFKEFYNSKPGYPPPRFDSDGHNLGDAEYNVPSPPERDIPVPKMMSSVNEKTSNKTMLSHSQQTSPISPLIMNWPQLPSSSSTSNLNLHRDTQTSLSEDEQKKMFSTSEDEKDSMKPRSETDSKIYSNLVANPIMISGEKYATNNNVKLGDVKSTTSSSSTYIIKQTPYYNTSTQTESVFPNTQALSNTGRNTELSKMKSAGVQVGLEKDFSHENSLKTAPLTDSKDSDSNPAQSKPVQSTGLQAVEGDSNANYLRTYQPMRRPHSEASADHVTEFINQASLLEERDQVSDMNSMKFNLESNKQPKQRSVSESEVRRPVTVENLLSGYQDYVPSTAPILRKLSEEFYMQAFRQGNVPPLSTSSSNLSASQETLTQGLKHADSNSSLVIKVSQPESATSSRSNCFSFPNQSSSSWETQNPYPVSANQHFSSQATTPFFESKEDQSLECQPNQSYHLPKKEKISNSYKQQNSGASYTSDINNTNRTSSTLQDLGMPEKFRAQVTSYAVPQKTQDLYPLSTTPLSSMHESSASTKLDASKLKKFHSSTSVLDSKKSAYGQDRLSFSGSQTSIFRKYNEDKSPSASNQSGEQISSSQITATRRASMKKAFGMYDETEAALSERSLVNYKQQPFESKELLETSENDSKFGPKWDHVLRRTRVREGLNEMGQSMQGEGLSNSSHNTQAAASIVHGRSDSLPSSVKPGDEDKFAVPQGPAPKKAYQSSVANQRSMNRTISETIYPLRSYTSNLDVTSTQTQEMSAKTTPEDGWNPLQITNPQSDSFDVLKNSRRRSYTSNDRVFKKSIFTAPINPRLYGDFQHVAHSKQDWQQQQQQNDNNNNTTSSSSSSSSSTTNNNNNNNSTPNTQSEYMDMSGRHQEKSKHQTEWARVRSQMSDSTRGLYSAVSFDKIKDRSSPESSQVITPSSSLNITNSEKKQLLLTSSLSSVPIYQNVAEKSAPTDVKFDGDLPPALPPRIYRLSSMDALTMNNSKSTNADSEDKSYGKPQNLSASFSGHFLRKQMYAEQVRAQARRFSEQAKGMYIVKTTPKIGIAEQTKVVTWADEPQIAVPAKPLDKDSDQSPKHHFSPEIATDVTEPEYPHDTYASYRSRQSHRSVGVYKRSKSTLDNSLLTDQDDDEKIRSNNTYGWKSEDNLGHVGFQSRASSEQCLAGIDQVSDQLYLHLSSSTVSLPTDAESAERTDPFISKEEENSDSQVSVKQRVRKFEVTKPEAKAKLKEERVKPCPPPVPAKPRSLLLRTSSEISAERKNSLPGQLLLSEDGDSLVLREKHHILGDFSKPSSDSGVSLESNISPLIHRKLSRNQFPPKPKSIATCDHSMGQASGDTQPTKCWDGGTENQQSSYLNITSESRYFPSKQSMGTEFPTSVESQSNKVTLPSNISPESRLSYSKQKDTKQNSRTVLQEKPSMSFATPVHLDSHFSHNQSEQQAPEKSANSVKIVSNTAETVSKCQPVYNAIHLQDSQNNNFFKEQAAVSLPQSEVSNNQDSSRVVVTSSLRRDSSDANSQQIQKSEQIQNESLPHKVAVSNNININNNSNSANNVNNKNNNHDTDIGGKSSTSDSETKKEYKISSHSRQPSQEELEFEIKAKELSQELKEDDKNLLQVLNPNNKKAIDFVEDLLENTAYDCQQIPTKLPKESSNTSVNESNPGSNTPNSQSGSQSQIISDSCKESEKCQETDEDALLQKKEGLRISIMKKLDVLRDAKQSVEREILEINHLGEKIANNFDESCPNSQEKNKYKSFLEDREMVIKLLLKLSVLLARAENSVQCLPAGVDARKRELAIEKREKLSRQHEEAKQLKSDIDRRQEQISNILKQYLSDEDLKDYYYYLSMKSRLIIESQELEDKIFLGQEQLSALKRSIPSSFLS